MTPNVLIVHPDLALAARLQQLILSGTDATVGFASSIEDGKMALGEYSYLDLCLLSSTYSDGDGAILVAAVMEKFPRARLAVLTDHSPDEGEEVYPGLILLPLPLNEAQFIFFCKETLNSLEGCQLAHFQVGVRIRSDRWGDWYQACETVLKREVYLAILHPWVLPEEAARFRAVSSLKARAAHNDVKSVYLAGDHAGRSFVSHEKWEMPHLIELAETEQKVDARMAVRILHTVGAVLIDWDTHQYPHPPLQATDVSSLSPQGVIKVENVVDPDWPFKRLETADLAMVARAVRELLPPEDEIPLQLAELFNKLRLHEQVVFETNLGEVVVVLYSEDVPLTVAHFLDYVDRKIYDNTLFHHIIADFIVQGGRLTQHLTKVPADALLPPEAGNELLNLKGTLAMVHDKASHNATSQFIFNLVDNPSLNSGPNDPGCTVFGKVIRGMDVIDKMAGVKVTKHGKYQYFPVKPVILYRVQRRSSITVAEVVAEAQALDIQLAISTDQPSKKSSSPDWFKGMTSTTKALAAISKNIFKRSNETKDNKPLP